MRSPTFGPLYSDVKGVSFNSAYSEDSQGNSLATPNNPAYVDRIELGDAELDYRLPLMAGFGVSYQQPDQYTLALDATVHLAQSRYALIDAEPVAPRAPNGEPVRSPGRVFEPDTFHKSKLVWNINLGAEAIVNEDWKVRGGLFTDRTTQETRLRALILRQRSICPYLIWRLSTHLR